MSTWRRKRNRLDREAYRGPEAFSLTVTTRQRQPVFVNSGTVDRCKEMLENSAARTGFRVLAYCFMPDHVHLLVEGSEDTELAAFMKHFKQVTSFDFKRRTGNLLWQRSFHDHVVRNDRDLEEIVTYILSNPVVAGLVEDAGDYPYFGGELLGGLIGGDLKVAATDALRQSSDKREGVLNA